jgi:cob(I)alamin adenosyltransferase
MYEEAYGTCDELNSMIGLALSFFLEDEKCKTIQGDLHIIQTALFQIGSELATPEGK